MSHARVTALSHTAVKGTRLSHPAHLDVDETGARDDRLFHVVAAAGEQQLGAKRPALTSVESTWDRGSGRLALRMPDGSLVEGRVELGGALDGRVTWDGLRPLPGREVLGPWARALSEHLGEPVALAMVPEATRALDVAPVTLVSEASVARLERELGLAALGSRRFRMNVVVDGVTEHEEDEWYGRRLRVGDCVLRVTGPVPRCAVVTRDPATGERDADVLRAIGRYRAPIPSPAAGGAEVKVPFGVYAVPERPGRITVGSRLELLD